jgi:C4-dicarboxylate transporter, DcuC family
LAAGYSPLMAAATLVVGCSGGGSLYNPGDADLVAIQDSSKAPMKLALDAMLWPLVCGFLASVVVLIILSLRRGRTDAPAPVTPEAPAEGPPQRWKALLPPLPVLMIFAMLPGWFFSSLPPPFEKGLPVSHAMLISTAIVLLACHREVSKTAKTFFEGMGYAYGNIISIVVTASCFIAGLTQMGLTEKLVHLVSGVGLGGKLAAGFFPGLLGVISGSGIGPSVAFSKAVLPSVSVTNLPAALDFGVTSAIAANFGRTMSPVAAVVIFCGTLVGVPALGIVKRTALPMIVGVGVAMLVVYLRSR